MQTLIFISTAWGKKYGGINAFNAELCKSFPSILSQSYKVVCVCFEIDISSVEKAAKMGVDLIHIENKKDNIYENTENIIFVLEKKGYQDVLWWFGHDVITGFIAKACHETSKTGNFAVFHHMNYAGYAGYKHKSGKTVVDKSKQQKEVLQAADIVLSIGPKLADSAKSILIDLEYEKKVFHVIPGLLEIKPSVQRQPFKAIVVGRLGYEDDIIKQFKLAVAAFGESIRRCSTAFPEDPTIILFGVPDDEAEETHQSLLKLGQEYAGKVINVITVPFIEDQDIIADHLRSSWVCLMLSLHEGFGLAGWEALAAEVPLIISENCGLYKFINNEKGGAGIGCLHSVAIEGKIGQEKNFSDNDVKNVSSALVAIALRSEDAKRNAQILHDGLIDCTWQRNAMEVATACSIPSIFISGENPGDFVKKFLSDKGAFDEHVSQRTLHFNQIFNKLKSNADNINRLILFGGIATMLRKAVKEYSLWLITNENAKLFICYESGKSAESRAKTIDESVLDLIDGHPQDAKEHMKNKEAEVLKLKNDLSKLLGPAVIDRIFFIPLCVVHHLTNYTIICGNDMYVAPVLHGRSSQTESIRLPAESSPYRNQFLDYMIFTIESCQDFETKSLLISEIEKVKLN